MMNPDATRSRWRPVGTVGIGAASFAILLSLLGCPEMKSSAAEKPKVLPTIELSLGEPWEAVVARSTAQLPLLRPQDVGTIVQTPHKFVYKHPQHQVVFEEAWYVRPALDQKRNIGDVGLGLFEGAAESKETWQRLQAIDEKMKKAGWVGDYLDASVRAQRPGNAETLRSDYLQRTGGGGATVATWYLPGEGLNAHLNITKTNSAAMDGGLWNHEPRFNLIFYFEPDLDVDKWHRRSKKMPE